MHYHFPDSREPKDIDTFSSEDLRPSLFGKSVENFWDPELQPFVGDRHSFATVDELYTIKCSHLYWDLKNDSWNKHANDVLFLKGKGAKLDLSLHALLYRVWEERYGKKKMDLKKEADLFFKDAVVRIYDHDSIHDSVAYFDKPLYTRILRDGATVDIDPKKLWEELTYEEQILLFREEINATALERLVIPSGYRVSPARSYHWALRRTITSLTKGKSARFVVTNLSEFWKADDYVTRHRSRLDKLIPLGVGSGSM